MESETREKKRRRVPWIIGTLTVGSLTLLVALQATGLWKEFSIDSSSDLLLLYTLSSLNFVAFIIFAFIFGRSIVKLMRERRTLELGAKIKTRLLLYFVALSLLPIIAMAVFSYLFMNRALERWFTQIPENVIREAREVQRQSILDRSAMLDESARMVATVIGDSEPTEDDLAQVADAGGLVHVGILGPGSEPLVAFDRGLTPEQQIEIDRILESIRAGDRLDESLRDSRGFDAAVSELGGGRRLVIIPDPFTSRSVSQIVENSLSEFERLKQTELNVRRTGLLTLSVLTFLLMFASSWVAFHVARGLTTPIKALAQGADEIARGNFGHRVEVLAEDELGLLVASFNEMSTKLESNSFELEERQRYIETLVDTLPTGVISFDGDDRVTTINSSAQNILRLEIPTTENPLLDEVVGAEYADRFKRLIVRARRVGYASDQVVLVGSIDRETAERTVALTATKLPSDAGVVLVIEDLSELIAAQRSSAWQEVARRMAHEIRNPLTPIQLSAERIAKRFSSIGHTENGAGKRLNDDGPLGDVVYQSTETILREVSSLKAMVDEFSRFARLPETVLSAGDLASVIRQAVAAFEGRQPAVFIEFVKNGGLPYVMRDAEQLKRVFVNLIDNAIEASESALDPNRVTITTRHDVARDLVITEVADNGKGIATSDLQKLFQPYFSTKGRNTGLGLAIVKRIISEHNGRIKAAANQPSGAKFIIELPAIS